MGMCSSLCRAEVQCRCCATCSHTQALSAAPMLPNPLPAAAGPPHSTPQHVSHAGTHTRCVALAVNHRFCVCRQLECVSETLRQLPSGKLRGLADKLKVTRLTPQLPCPVGTKAPEPAPETSVEVAHTVALHKAFCSFAPRLLYSQDDEQDSAGRGHAGPVRLCCRGAER